MGRGTGRGRGGSVDAPGLGHPSFRPQLFRNLACCVTSLWASLKSRFPTKLKESAFSISRDGCGRLEGPPDFTLPLRGASVFRQKGPSLRAALLADWLMVGQSRGCSPQAHRSVPSAGTAGLFLQPMPASRLRRQGEQWTGWASGPPG